MTIAQTAFHTFRVVNQLQQNLVGLQRDMRSNAVAWRAMATAQSPNVATLAQFTKDAATSYQTRLGWVLTYKNTSANWPAVTAMLTALGGNITDATTLYTQMKAVADQLAAANLTTFAQISTACDQILSAVQAPDSIWPE